MKFGGILLALSLLIGSSSEARVFNFKNEKFATYFRGTAGLSGLKKTAFESSGGQNLTFSDQPNYNYTAEFGLLFSVSRMNVRMGLELFRPNAATGVEAKDASDVTLYTLNSTVIGYGGVMNLEFNMIEGDKSRLFFSGGGGYFTTSLKNEYAFTTAGNSAYPTVPNYVEEGSGYSFMGQASFGYEFHLSDTTTTVFDAGYRYMLVNSLKHSRDAVTLLDPATPVTSGSNMKNRDGSDRTLDLSGIWVGLSLRIYIGL
ncbi:MAG: hypothetical protein ABL958_00175 [Bdellovibrionia bacterium]